MCFGCMSWVLPFWRIHLPGVLLIGGNVYKLFVPYTAELDGVDELSNVALSPNWHHDRNHKHKDMLDLINFIAFHPFPS